MKIWKRKKLYAIVLLGAVLYLSQLLLCLPKDTANTQEEIAILGFHNVVMDDEKDAYYKYNMWVDDKSTFEEKIKYLYDQGYQSLSLDELYDWLQGERTIPEKSVVLTFDDGYYASSYLIEPILARYGFQATTFVIGSSLEEKEHSWNARQLQFVNKQDIERQGTMSYASHTYGMHGKQENKFLIDLFTKKEMQEDVERQKELVDTSFLAYPYGHYNDKIIEVLEENQVKLAFGFNEDRKASHQDSQYKVPRFSINAFTSMEVFQAMLDS